MEVEKSNQVSVLKRYGGILKNGLLLLGIRNRLAKIGIDFMPYYWVQEEVEPCTVPIINDTASYRVRYLSKEEFIKVCHLKPGKDFDKMIEGLDIGQLVIALETNNIIAAYTFVELKDIDFRGRKFKLKNDEAYLLNMWTFHDFRGKNLAPYLRYQTYRLLEERGVNKKYSITNYFNRSSIKFKNKLNSRHQALYLAVELFKKYNWNFRLKEY